MKILLVVTKGDHGGAQKRMLDLATRLQDKGVDVTVAFGSYGSWLSAQLRQAGIARKEFANLSRANPFKIIIWLFQFFRYLTREDFDVVHLNSSSALSGALSAHMAGVKSVFTFRGLSIVSPNYPAIAPLKWFYWLAFRVCVPFVDVGVFQCKHDRKVAADRGLAPTSSVVVRPGIDPQAIGFLSPEKAKAKLESEFNTDFEDTKLIGSIGRLHAQKNYAFLLQSFANTKRDLDNTQLVIIGDGELRDKLEKWASELGVDNQVHFAGEITGAARYLKAFDLFVLPSLYEGVSMTLTEAVHAGVPILTSDVGGNAETVCENEQSLFALDNNEEFERKMVNTLTNEPANQRARASQNCADTLLLSKSIEEYRNLYTKVADAYE